MLHHVALEVKPGALGRAREFWAMLGFEEVAPPASLSDTTWFEREGTQIHLLHVEQPAVPGAGHAAVVVDDLEQAIARLEDSGFEVERRAEHWGAPRAKANAPGGHTVELMASPPGRAVD
jgi:catechol 2,3-dioxygenase-like lactoylglutathione lyase family enzyme